MVINETFYYLQYHLCQVEYS